MKLATIHLVLSEVRKERGISQTDLANALNIEQAAVSMYENGKRGIPLGLLDHWLGILDIEITITPRGYETTKTEDDTQRDLETFERLKKRRNYLIAELRTMMAEKVMQAPEFQEKDAESGESRFWAYSFHDDSSIGLVETRYDHPSQKHLAVEYTSEEVNVYKFSLEGRLESTKDNLKSRGIDRAYFSEDDFLAYGSVWNHEDMESQKSTIFRANTKSPDGLEIVSAEGFPIRSLLDMQEIQKHFMAIYDEITGQALYQNMLEDLLRIEGRLDELLIDNRLENGMQNPAFIRWAEGDEEAVSVPLHSEERCWRWVEEGVEWIDDCTREIEVRLWADSDIHDGYMTHVDQDGKRIIGTVGPDGKPAVFKRNPAKPDVLYRVETELNDLTDDEMARYEKILESAHQLDNFRTTE